MRRALLIPLLFLTASCVGSRGPSSPPAARLGHGAINVQIVPNPIVAQHVSGAQYDFPFDVVVRETGGHPVTVIRVSTDVYAMGGLHVASESYSAARIGSLGFPTALAANGTLQYHLNPRKSVADERLFGGVSADVRVDATDDTGAAATAKTTVTVRR